MPEDLVIARYDKDLGRWVSLDNIKVDPATNSISGQTSHFTPFAVVARAAPAPTPIPSKPDTEVVAATPTPIPSMASPEGGEGGGLPFWLWIIVGLMVISLVAVGSQLVLRRRASSW